MKLRFPAVLAVLLLVVMAVGCGTNRKPLFDMSSGEPDQFRRYSRRPMVDYIFRWSKKAFTKVNSDVDFAVTHEDQRDVLSRHGQPDYIRLDVRAQRDELFDEWVYWDRNVIVQFVSGELVYEGPLMDSDRYLVEWGFPSWARSQELETGPLREIWIYEHVFEIGSSQTVSFTDGKLAYRGRT